jgi:hypothetical protein
MPLCCVNLATKSKLVVLGLGSQRSLVSVALVAALAAAMAARAGTGMTIVKCR